MAGERIYQKLDIDDTPADNDHSFFDTADGLWHPKAHGLVGYVNVTSDQATITTIVDLTGLEVAYTYPAGCTVRVTGFANFLASDIGIITFSIREGSTTLAQGLQTTTALGASTGMVSAIITPSAAAHTYKLSAETTGAGSITMDAGSDHPAYISVEIL